jgi:hypothetical protein
MSSDKNRAHILRTEEREKQTGGRIPIVAITAYPLERGREDGFTTKAIRPSELFAVIEKMLVDTPKSEIAEVSNPLPL